MTYVFTPSGIAVLPIAGFGGNEGKQAFRAKARAEIERLGASHYVVICECWITAPGAARQECLIGVVGGDTTRLTTLTVPIECLHSAEPTLHVIPNDGLYADLGGWATKRAVEQATELVTSRKWAAIDAAQQQQLLDTVNRVRDRMLTSELTIDEITDEAVRGSRPAGGSTVMTPVRNAMTTIVAGALGLIQAETRAAR